MNDNSQNLLDETPEVEAEAPEQQSVHKWEYRPRQIQCGVPLKSVDLW